MSLVGLATAPFRILAVLVCFVNLFVVSFVSCFAMFLLSTFKPARFAVSAINHIMYVIFELVVFIAERLCLYDCIVNIDNHHLPFIGREKAIMNWNHRYDLDFLSSWVFGSRLRMLDGCKVVIKDEIKKVPIFGKLFYWMDMIFVQRDWAKDQVTLAKSLDILSKYAQNYYLLVFCEGTRYTDAKMKASQEFAESRGIHQLKYHLQPRPKGFIHIVENLRESLSAFYDCTVAIKNESSKRKPSLLALAMGDRLTAHCYMRRYPTPVLPKGDEALNKFLFQLYREKDEAFDKWMQTGSFPEMQHELQKRVSPVFNTALTLCFITVPFLSISSCILNALPSFVFWSMIGLFVAILVIFFVKIIAVTLSGVTGSKYGAKTDKKEQ